MDHHATVAEAVADFDKREFQVQTVILPTGKAANMHPSTMVPEEVGSRIRVSVVQR